MKFIKFTDNLKTEDNLELLEAIQHGYSAIYESYASTTELVPVQVIDRYKEFTREVPMHGNEQFQELKADIKENGIKEPLIIAYYQYSKTALLVEGNHRLRIAKELGMSEVPVRVSRYQGDDSHYPKAKPVPGYQANEHGYVPGDLKPSDIGLV
mgnify:CR=1 FL=1|jgi:hypothetical protein